MTFKRGDLVTFTEDDKVLVLEAIVYEGVEYLFVNEVVDDEAQTTDRFKIMKANYDDGTLEKVIDPELLNQIVPIFTEKLQEYNN